MKNLLCHVEGTKNPPATTAGALTTSEKPKRHILKGCATGVGLRVGSVRGWRRFLGWGMLGDGEAVAMTGEITRRDFLGATLLAAGSALLEGLSPAELLARGAVDGQAFAFNGYGGVGEYAPSNGNTWEVLQAGHTIRDRVYERTPKDVVETGEKYDCVVVGGGISG